MHLALWYNVTKRIYERRILHIDSSNSYNNCCCHDGHDNGDFMVMMTESLASIFSDLGAQVNYPHGVQTPTREHETRERAKQVASIKCQSVDEYRDQFRREILAILGE